MIEFTNILIILFLNLFIFYIPSLIEISNLKKINILKIKVCFNLILFLNLFLILSFFKINFDYLLYTILSLNLIQLIIFIKHIKPNKDIRYFYYFLMLIGIVLSINLSVNLKLEWDASVNWIFKTLNFYNGFAFDNLKNVPGVTAYPHLGSYVWAFFWDIGMFNKEYTGRIFFLILFIFSIILNSFNPKNNILWNFFIILILTTIFFDQNAFTGYQEGFMFSLIAILFFLINKIKKEKKINFKFIILLLLNFNLLLWIKNEGYIWSILIIIFFVYSIKNNFYNKIVIFIGFSLLLTIKSFIFFKFFGENLIGWKGYTFLPLDENFLSTIFERLPFIIFSIVKVFFKYPFLIIAVLILAIKLREKKNYDLLLFLMVNIIVTSSIFILADNSNWKFHTNVGLDRMLYQTSGFYIFLIAKFFHEIIFKYIKINGKN